METESLEARSQTACREERMESMSLKRFHPRPRILVIATVLFAVLTPSLLGEQSKPGLTASPESEAKREAMRLFRLYSELEERQDYTHIYDLLSRRFKEELKKESKVKTASDYNQLRLSSEAQWTQFRMVKISKEQGGLKCLVTANVEEAGDKEKVTSTYRLIEENGKWKIDSWNY
jgi:hypothetical protein